MDILRGDPELTHALEAATRAALSSNPDLLEGEGSEDGEDHEGFPPPEEMEEAPAPEA